MYTARVPLLSYTGQYLTEAMEESKEVEKNIEKDDIGGVDGYVRVFFLALSRISSHLSQNEQIILFDEYIKTHSYKSIKTHQHRN